MSSKSVEINTVEELVKFTVSNPYYADTKFDLFTRVSWEFVDEAAGKSWREEYERQNDIVRGHWNNSSVSEEEKKVASAALDEITDVKPEMRPVTTYSLNEKSDSYRTMYIRLSEDLGKMIDSVWTKVPAYKRAKYTKNSPYGLTLKGILNRLGVTEVKSQIDAENERIRLEREKQTRNNTRRVAAEYAEQLKKFVEKHPELLAGKTLDELMNPEYE